ncbi:hypothetical protein LIA77_08617 [Sarocladium implicatum]|nr:hypothetical protein LIA77_08617 [Sarocladium implicatum]
MPRAKRGRPAAQDDAALIEAQMLAGSAAPPRRNAPPASEFSIATRPEAPEGDSEHDVDIDEEDEEDAARDANGPLGEEDDETRLAVMAADIFDARRLSEDLWTRLRNPNDTPQYLHVLNSKRRTWKSVRDEYEDPHIVPFIDTRRLRLLDERTGGQGDAFTTLRKMNLVSALDIIQEILRGNNEGIISFLESMTQGIYPFLFNGDPDTKFDDPETVLDMYTHLVIEKLAADKGATDPKAVIAQVFCSTDSDDYAKLFSHGPFNSQAVQSEEMMADRIQDMMIIIRKARKDRIVSALRENYDQQAFLAGLRSFILESWPQPSDRDVFHDASESMRFQSTPVGFNSQPMQPPGTAPAGNPAHDPRLIQPASPTNRRQTMAAPTHGGYPSPSGGISAAQASFDASRAAAAEGLSELGEQDPFQTDTRAVRNVKRPAASSAPRQTKRQRISDAHLPPSSAPPGTAPPQYSTQGVAPVIADFEAVKARKRALTAQARAERPEGPVQQRKPWSANDCTTLLHCIWERHASWSQIQGEDGGKFEVQRNQQAFRDKARNMKVDYLITDAVLPPCFDLVALGKKENERLIAMGKNPNRREADLDDQGMPINTAYVPPPPPEQEQEAQSQHAISSLAAPLAQEQQQQQHQQPSPQMASESQMG